MADVVIRKRDYFTDYHGEPPLATDQPSSQIKWLEFSFDFPPDIAPKKSDMPDFQVFYRNNGVDTPAVRLIVAGGDSRPADDFVPYWTASLEQESFVGQVVVRVSWTSPLTGAEIREQAFAAGEDVNVLSVIEALPTEAPQLSALLNQVAPTVPVFAPLAGSPTAEQQQIVDILNHVNYLLHDGLGQVWKGASAACHTTKGGKAISDLDPAGLTPREQDECWAQLLSEFMVGSCYAGPPSYSGGETDSTFFAEATDGADPAHSIFYACQHLCDMAAITRGFDDVPQYPIDRTSASNITHWKKNVRSGSKPKILNGTPNADPDKAYLDSNPYRVGLKAKSKGYLRPCTFYARVPTAFHIAFVLRALESGQFQLLDTGAMDPDTENTDKGPLGRGNWDRLLGSSIINKIAQVAAPPYPADLVLPLRRARSSRPLGFGRLVIYWRTPPATSSPPSPNDRLAYATPLLPLWRPGVADANYSITRLIWSLRNHPHLGTFEARWLVDAPLRATFDAVKTQRAFSWGSMNKAQSPSVNGFRLQEANALGVDTSGRVVYRGSFKTSPPANNHWWDEEQDNSDTTKQRRLPYLTSLPIGGPVAGASPSYVEVLDSTRHINARSLSGYIDAIPEYLRGLA